MKKILTFKTPGVLDGVTPTCEEYDWRKGCQKEECTCIDENEKVTKILSKFIQYGEILRVEFDLEAGTARVLEVTK